MKPNPEVQRLLEEQRRSHNWKRWGPYLSERQWGTVREDYSPDGSCWTYFPHDHARSRAYRWGEDGLLGWTDRECRLCFSFAFWNGKDPILKERFFGLTGPEGNHGEDVKEEYYYLDGTPTHSYMRALYKYPQREYPYGSLVSENARRGRAAPEFELADAGLFADQRYFDVFVEYAKHGPNDTLIRATLINRGPDDAHLVVLPTLWFRNNWAWGRAGEGYGPRPRLSQLAPDRIRSEHSTLEPFVLAAAPLPGKQLATLFTENETNIRRLFGSEMRSPYVKDSFHDYVIHGATGAVNPAQVGTKAAFLYHLVLAPGQSQTIDLRLFAEGESPQEAFGAGFDEAFALRRTEADLFYKERAPASLDAEQSAVMRQAYAGMLWSKQFYYYSVREWLEGDPTQPAPAASRTAGRNVEWPHLYNRDVILMPDKWEYPWYAAWDLAFHVMAFCRIDPEFSKQQLILFLREWYMHPNGQIPAYEFALGDVNPPVHAWAAWRVYKITGPRGARDREFLARVFHKLLLNFTWWVNRKDIDGKNLFSGGFLGLDNIGVFDRSAPLPTGGHLEQADGTAWMAFYCMQMLAIALELAVEDPSYEDVASKFFEHFVAITDAANSLGGTGLWDEVDGFYYDQLHMNGKSIPLRVRSLVGVIPLFAVLVLEDEVFSKLPGFRKRMNWFLEHRGDLARNISYMEHAGSTQKNRALLAVPSRERLQRVLRYLLDEREFLSPYGIRSLSKHHEQHPYVFKVSGGEYTVRYDPGESTTTMFGGNSNWRGPVWFPLNYLIIESLQRYHYFYGDNLKVECPTGSGCMMNLKDVATELARRLTLLFCKGEAGAPPAHGSDARYREDPAYQGLTLFYEYFHGDTGKGLGASHQTGWTALVTHCLTELAGR